MTSETCRTVREVIGIVLAFCGIAVVVAFSQDAIRDAWWSHKRSKRRDYDAMERSEPGNAGVEGLKPAPERTA
jgi:hypothetical protein